MRPIRPSFFVLVPLLTLGLASCDMFAGEDAHPWAVDGTRFVYNFRPVSDTLLSEYGAAFRYSDTDSAIAVVVTDETVGEFSVELRFVSWQAGGFPTPLLPYFAGLDGTFTERRTKGLFVRVPEACSGDGDLVVRRFAKLRLPTSARAGERVPVYACGREVEYYLDVTAVGETAVPAGRYRTFALGTSRQVEYWSERHGLIKIEMLRDGQVLGVYELASAHYGGGYNPGTPN